MLLRYSILGVVPVSDSYLIPIRVRYVSDTPTDVLAYVAYLYLTTVADMLFKATDMDGSARYGWDTSKPRFCISSTPLRSKVKTKKTKRDDCSLWMHRNGCLRSPISLSPPSPLGLRFVFLCNLVCLSRISFCWLFVWLTEGDSDSLIICLKLICKLVFVFNFYLHFRWWDII